MILLSMIWGSSRSNRWVDFILKLESSLILVLLTRRKSFLEADSKFCLFGKDVCI